MKNKNIVARDVAQAEFERFLEFYDLEVPDDEAARELVLKHIMLGAIEIDDTATLTFNTRREPSKSITFREPTGAVLMAMDKRKSNEDIAKTYVAMAEMTSEPAKVFSEMKISDLKVCLAVFTLFLV